MLNGQRILAIIPARGGSKGLPRKNVLSVAGKPLLAWTIEAAKCSKYIDHLILSSDDPEIIAVAQQWQCEVPFVRPTELAQDNTTTIDVVLHALQLIPEYDFLVLLQPTSPLRTGVDIDNCIEKCIISAANTCVSVTEATESPYWMFRLNEQAKLQPVLNLEKMPLRRQDTPKVFILNGAVYVARCDWLLQHKVFVNNETIAYDMPQERSLDIDTRADFLFFKALMEVFPHATL